jgi:hypothetical protein
MRTLLMAVLLGIAAVGRAASTNETSAAAAPTNAPAFSLESISGQDFERLRDPFWPVGWRPEAKDPTRKADLSPAVAMKWAEARKLLQVTGFGRTTGGRRMAIIKGVGVVEEGDVISVHFEGAVYRWAVRSITETEIVTEKIGAYADGR